MSNKMIERVARASFSCWRKRMDDLGYHDVINRSFEDMSEQEHEFLFIHARAAIEAMREPTEEMANNYYVLSHKTEIFYVSVWQRSIDAALKDD